MWRFICYSLKIKFFSFPKKLASHNSMQKKDDKVGKKLLIKKKGKEKKRATEKDRNSGLCACVKDKKSCIITSD